MKNEEHGCCSISSDTFYMYKDFITGSETNIEQRLWLTIITYVKDYTKIMFIENKPVQCRCRSVSNNYAHLHTSSPKTFTPDGAVSFAISWGRAGSGHAGSLAAGAEAASSQSGANTVTGAWAPAARPSGCPGPARQGP